jgi:hypothetical protein
MTKGFDRIFVALSREPYAWFESGEKVWELRKYGRQFTEKHIYPGRRVELRRGYSDASRTLWGTIQRVEKAVGIEDFFDKVPYSDVIPVAKNRADAAMMAKEILGIGEDPQVPLVGFMVSVDKC